jgi:hypothetical protein
MTGFFVSRRVEYLRIGNTDRKIRDFSSVLILF